MEETLIRPSTVADIPLILNMLEYSRSLMRADGNMTQWVGYPTREDVLDDIARGVSYLIGEQGTVAMVPGIEPTYAYIDHGRWIDTTTPYTTLHRMAKAPGTHGIADIAFSLAKQRYAHLRVDTHATNRAMRHLLDKEGFVYCGIIYMPDGSPRVAYEWWRYDEVPESLKTFIEQSIIPQYDGFDAAHRRDHARRVIARAMIEGERLKVKDETTDAIFTSHLLPLTYVAAAMHDLGLAEGRETHHLASGRIIRDCRELRRWFSEEDVELIAQAAEDHRASATAAPRSLLGCIVAEADRDVEPETIVRRTVEYGLSHYPELDREGHWQRTLQHLHEKYAEGGYIKLWLDDSINVAPLAELRTLIRDEARLRQVFEKFFKL